jgi:hypothetical protein
MENGQAWMKRLTIPATVVAAAAIAVALVCWFRWTTVVLVIRHAERNDVASCGPPEAGPPLSVAGQARA